jgi:hypothetical protein
VGVPEADSEAEERSDESEREELPDDLPPEEVVSEARRRGLGSLLGLLDSGARRGQDLVTEVAKGSKDELVRVISAEFRGFLDKMDIVDLAQEIVSGLKVEAHIEIKFSRDKDGRVQPEVTKSETKLGSKSDEPSKAGPSGGAAKKGAKDGNGR